jgi:hypothetical protein
LSCCSCPCSCKSHNPPCFPTKSCCHLCCRRPSRRSRGLGSEISGPDSTLASCSSAASVSAVCEDSLPEEQVVSMGPPPQLSLAGETHRPISRWTPSFSLEEASVNMFDLQCLKPSVSASMFLASLVSASMSLAWGSMSCFL